MVNMKHSQPVDIICKKATNGDQTPFVVVNAGLHGSQVQDTLHRAQGMWP